MPGTSKNIQGRSRMFRKGQECSGKVKDVQERSRTFRNCERSETFILSKINGLKTFAKSRSRFKNERKTVLVINNWGLSTFVNYSLN
jgi:hypothetical protein